MVVRDERDPAAGALTAGLTGAQWAWKFLRRNTDYRQDWSKSITVWRELEAAYSAPPRHGFAAWRQNPRAWLRASHCPEGDARVGQNKVSIDCAFGARWGFHKFPTDPADDAPVGAGRLRECSPHG